MPPASPCPSDDQLAAFGRGALDDAARRDLLAHLDACELCHEVVVAAARADAPAGDAAPAIGRYLIERPLGAGAMGLVFAARDPDLDRRVALKLLRKPLALDEDRRLEQRLLGEARALARLAHPNVVAAFEVARHDGELYLVMELVAGPTLGAWLAGDQPWTARLAMLVQAGRGLAAAHAAGIVHRDFKLDNVLVGPDGRARVTDFGLASGSLSGPATDELRSGELALTMTGALAGTPLFMAPEVLRGEPATAASDQFSFAVSLWTALHNVRPFRGGSIAALIEDIERGEPRGHARIPPALRAVVRRGLAADPAARWPSVDAMLDACDRIARPRARWRYAALAGVVAVAVAGTAIALTRGRPASCDLAAGDTLWDASTATRIRARLDLVAPARAGAIAGAIAGAVEGWRERWRGERASACGAADPGRLACLDFQLRRVTSIVDQFATADAAIADGAIDAARRLPDPRGCAGAAPIAGGDPALLQRLAEIEATRHVGKFVAARDAARQLIADTAGRPALELRARLLHAESQYDASDRAEAVASFHAAIDLASELGDDHAIAEALVHLVSTHAALAQLDAHQATARLADAALRRAGGDLELAAMLAMGRCRAGWRRPAADHDRGLADCREAARQWRALRGDDAPELAWVENQLGLLAVIADRPAEALGHFQEFEDRSRRSHGDDYVNLDVARVNRASALVKLGRHAEAEPVFRGLIERRGWGSALEGLGDALRGQGRLDEALRELERAAVWNREHGYLQDNCGTLTSIAEVVHARGGDATTALGDATEACARAPKPGVEQRLATLRTARASR